MLPELVRHTSSLSAKPQYCLICRTSFEVPAAVRQVAAAGKLPSLTCTMLVCYILLCSSLATHQRSVNAGSSFMIVQGPQAQPVAGVLTQQDTSSKAVLHDWPPAPCPAATGWVTPQRTSMLVSTGARSRRELSCRMQSSLITTTQ